MDSMCHLSGLYTEGKENLTLVTSNVLYCTVVYRHTKDHCEAWNLWFRMKKKRDKKYTFCLCNVLYSVYTGKASLDVLYSLPTEQ